jgi:hypothetical protein
MTVKDDRDNSPLEEQIFGVILLPVVPTVSFGKFNFLHKPPDKHESVYYYLGMREKVNLSES